MSNALANRRQLRRHKLSANIQVIDQLRDQPVGKLVDIHQEGLLLIGNELRIDSSHQIRLILPSSVNLRTNFQLGIECLWSQSAESGDSLYWTGCSIIDKSMIASACIESLINIQS